MTRWKARNALVTGTHYLLGSSPCGRREDGRGGVDCERLTAELLDE